MGYIKWAFRIAFVLLFVAVLHYTLPQHDVVRITDTETKRVDFGVNSLFWASADSGSDATQVNRDVYFIRAIMTDGDTMEYRNEDTGFGWPPYFKFDTSSLQTEASDLKSNADDPQWVVVRHYGWRSNLMSTFPNAVKIWPVDGPDQRIIPVFNIIFFVVLTIAIWAVNRRWMRFRENRIDPMIEDLEDSYDIASDAISDRRGRIARWFGRNSAR